jgi:hypothetical protein
MKKIITLLTILGLLLVCSNGLVAEMVIESDRLNADNGIVDDAYAINSDDDMVVDNQYMSDAIDYDVAPLGVGYGVSEEIRDDENRRVENRDIENINRGMNRGMEGATHGRVGHGGRR